MAVSRKKTTKTKTKPVFDMNLPVSLRERGIDRKHNEIEKKKIEPITVIVRQHVESPHVLQLKKTWTQKTATPQNVSAETKKDEQTFDEFARDFFANLDLESSTEIAPFSTEADTSIDESVLKSQLSENDINDSKKHFPLRTRIKIKKLPFKFKLTVLHPSLRGISVFVLLSFMFVLPLQAMNTPSQAKIIKNDVFASGTAAMSEFKNAASATYASDFQSAQQNFENASYLIKGARQTLDELNTVAKLVASISPIKAGRDFKTGKALLNMGEELAVSAERISAGLVAISNLADSTLGTKIEVLERYVESAIPHLSSANEALSRINAESIPSEFKQTFLQLSQNLPQFESGVQKLQTFSSALNTVLGNEQKQRYLFVFQNDSEIRPAGGFIGSFAEVDIYRGEIEKMNLPGDGSYNLQGRLLSQVAAPAPLTLVNARWEFQDANWFPDFKASAEKLLWFHNKAGGPTMDGVIAINASFVADLLELVGPIEMPEYGRTITSDNFMLETQKIVEVEYDKTENKPKQFLADLAPKLIERITNADKFVFIPLLECLSEGLANKDIQLYFTDADTQKAVSELGWTGEISNTDGDYLMVIDSNIGGQKTDAVIDETIDLISKIAEDGTITNEVSITRRHHGISGAQFTGVNNVDYVQLFVPRGSKLISVDGAERPNKNLFETSDIYLDNDEDLAFFNASSTTGDMETDIGEMFGKTIFGNWVQTKPGQQSTISFTYELPWKLDWETENEGLFEIAGDLLGLSQPAKHTLTIEPQSGMRGRTVNATILFPENKPVVWSSSLTERGAMASQIIGTSSGFLALLFEK
jgi:hypothetical protein